MAQKLWFVIQREERDYSHSPGFSRYSEAVTACREIRNQGGISTQYPKILVLDKETGEPVSDQWLTTNLEIPFWAQSRFRERDFDCYRK